MKLTTTFKGFPIDIALSDEEYQVFLYCIGLEDKENVQHIIDSHSRIVQRINDLLDMMNKKRWKGRRE